ncbi:MAG: hypothetical protein H0V30_06220 [Chitinophagaceae bacterium]|jgi:hypothetical protein|nr:hypothetical protein [Chitinophagaceae bacterium]
MKYLLAFCLLILVFNCDAQTKLKPSYNGLYHTLSDTLNPFRFYLRFYPEGDVIGYTTAGNPQNLVKWFSKDHKSPTKGQYVIEDTVLSFTLKSKEGLVNYEGVILPDNRLFLHIKSLINKYEGKETYFFWPVAELK